MRMALIFIAIALVIVLSKTWYSNFANTEIKVVKCVFDRNFNAESTFLCFVVENGGEIVPLDWNTGKLVFRSKMSPFKMPFNLSKINDDSKHFRLIDVPKFNKIGVLSWRKGEDWEIGWITDKHKKMFLRNGEIQMKPEMIARWEHAKKLDEDLAEIIKDYESKNE